MSHPEQLAYFTAVARVNRPLVEGGRILEIGSYDVNGTVRKVFDGGRDYVGVDLTDGPGVDHVGFGHEYDEPDGAFDIAISGECFEHDKFWRESFANMVRLVRPGGLVASTCASRGRPEHGTSRSDVSLSPGTQAVGLDYYRNLTEANFAPLALAEWFDEWRFWYLPTNFDLYFAGRRAGGTGAVLPTGADVRAHRRHCGGGWVSCTGADPALRDRRGAVHRVPAAGRAGRVRHLRAAARPTRRVTWLSRFRPT